MGAELAVEKPAGTVAAGCPGGHHPHEEPRGQLPLSASSPSTGPAYPGGKHQAGPGKAPGSWFKLPTTLIRNGESLNLPGGTAAAHNVASWVGPGAEKQTLGEKESIKEGDTVWVWVNKVPLLAR